MVVARAPQTHGEPEGELARLAQQLYRVLTDDAPGLRFNVRHGCQLRDARTRQPILASRTDEWRAARDLLPDGTQRDRRASWRVLHQHLVGRYDVAIQAPSWSSLVVLDIDRPELGAAAGDPLAELQADGRRDEVLARVWRAYGFGAERQPVILATPGGGYHVYLPHCRDERRRPDQHAWPIAWARQHHEHHLDRARLGLKPGVLELYPTGVPLRAPCGRGMALLVPQNPDDPDDLRLELQHAQWEPRVDARTGARTCRLRRDVPGLVRGFLERLERARRPLEAWLDPEPGRPAWGARFGPFGDRHADAVSPPATAPYQHIGDSSRRGGRRPPSPLAPQPSLSPPARGQAGSAREDHPDPDPAPSPRAGHLLYGAAFRARIAQLLTLGLTTPGERHDAALKLGYFHHVCRRLHVADALEEIRTWLLDPRHVSATKACSPGAFVEDTLREVQHYLERHLARAAPKPATEGEAARPALRRAVLSPADEAVIAAAPEDVRPEVRTVLAFVATYADEAGRVPHPVTLSAATLERLLGQRRITRPDGARARASVVAVEALEALGVLAVHKQYAVGRHGRQFTCWYRFGSGELPPRDPDLGVVLGTRLVAEGALVAVHGGVGEAPRARFASLREGLRPVLDALARPEAWWARMYQRRAFTPAEFFEADERHILPGPFRDRHVRRQPPVPTVPPSVPAPTVPARSPTVGAEADGVSGGGGRRAGPHRPPELAALRATIAQAEARGDTDTARRALVELWAALRRHHAIAE